MTYLGKFSVVDMTTAYVEEAAELEHRQRRVLKNLSSKDLMLADLYTRTMHLDKLSVVDMTTAYAEEAAEL